MMKSIVTILILFIISIGLLHAQDTIRVDAGWNMIGAKSTKLQNGFTSEPAGIITSQYYGYKSGVGYFPADTLYEGKGFWVKASQEGILITVLANQPPGIPSNPIPDDNVNGIFTSLILSWKCIDPENDPLTYDIYFGTDNPPTTLIKSDHADTNISRSGLSDSITYYWKVVAKDDHGNSTDGIVWSFTTAGHTVITCPGMPTILYSGKTYNTVQIGTQCWLKENLDVGTMVDGSGNQSHDTLIEKYCYENNEANCLTYGGLYQWGEAMQYSSNPQGICPTGWHIPTIEELQALGTFVGNDGNALKAVGEGQGGGAGTNTSGFSALRSPYRVYNGGFQYLVYSYFWSSTDFDFDKSLNLRLSCLYSDFVLDDLVNEYGFSVRCLKD